MDIFTAVLLGVALAMDAFAVSICKGLATGRPTVKGMLTVGIWFGLFQALMPTIGFFLGRSVHSYIESVDHWIAFILLLLIGINMIREAVSGEEEDADADLRFKSMFILAVATSIDALAVGISMAMSGGGILVPAIIIGVVTMIISAIGFCAGSLVGKRFGNKAEILGGCILIFIGAEILAEHLGFL